MQAVSNRRPGLRSPLHARRVIFLAVVTLLLTPVMSLEGQEECDEDLVYAPDELVHGKTLGQWSAFYLQWLLAIPKPSSPENDLNGERCAIEQVHPVFFLHGRASLAGPLVLEECAVPCGRDILVPLSSIYGWMPGDCEPGQLEVCRDIVKGIVDTIDDLRLVVDGSSIGCLEDHRAVSPEFQFTVPPDNIIDLPPPLERTGVAEGHYVILRASALTPGKHTITWSTTWNGVEFPKLTYELTVGPCDGAPFRRADSDGNGAVNVTDAVAALSFLFAGADALPCRDAADSNDDGGLNVTDAVHTLLWLFQGGTVPPAPGPVDCGADPTEDSLDCTRGC